MRLSIAQQLRELLAAGSCGACMGLLYSAVFLLFAKTSHRVKTALRIGLLFLFAASVFLLSQSIGTSGVRLFFIVTAVLCAILVSVCVQRVANRTEGLLKKKKVSKNPQKYEKSSSQNEKIGLQ